MIFVIDYSGDELAINGHSTEGALPTEPGEYLIVRGEDDLATVEPGLLLRIINFGKRQHKELPPDPGHVAWNVLNGKVDEPVIESSEPGVDQPIKEKKSKKKSKKDLQTSSNSNISSSPKSDPASDDKTETDMAAKNKKVASKKTASKKAGKAASKKKVANGAEPTKVRALKTDGVVYQIKTLLLKNVKLTNEQIEEKLKAKGYTPSMGTIITFRQDFIHSLRFLKANGYDIPGIEA